MAENQCPCGLTKELCGQKHLTIDRDMSQFREDLGKLRNDCDQHIKEAEERIVKGQDICETHMLERMGFQHEIIRTVTDNIRDSYKDGLNKLTDGLNLHRQDIDILEEKCETIPTKGIERLVSLERWRWWLGGLGAGLVLAQFLMWKYFDHLSSEFDVAIKTVKALVDHH